MQFERLPFEFARHLRAVKFLKLRYETCSQVCESFPACNAIFLQLLGLFTKTAYDCLRSKDSAPNGYELPA